MLSEALRLIRVFHDEKQSDLAANMGLARSYISEIETGRKSPTIDVIQKYSTHFGIPASSILFFAEQLPGSERRMPYSERTRALIARKIINFLRIIDEETRDDGQETHQTPRRARQSVL